MSADLTFWHFRACHCFLTQHCKFWQRIIASMTTHGVSYGSTATATTTNIVRLYRSVRFACLSTWALFVPRPSQRRDREWNQDFLSCETFYKQHFFKTHFMKTHFVANTDLRTLMQTLAQWEGGSGGNETCSGDTRTSSKCETTTVEHDREDGRGTPHLLTALSFWFLLAKQKEDKNSLVCA